MRIALIALAVLVVAGLCYSVSVALTRKQAVGHARTADIHYRSQEYDRAITEVSRAIDLAPQPKYYLLRGICYTKNTQRHEAYRDFSTALAMARTQQDTEVEAVALCLMGRIEDQRGRHADARARFEQALRLAPGEARNLNCLAWLLATCPQADLRDGARAVTYATKACAATQWQRPAYLDTLAAAYALTGDFARAVQYQQQAVSLLTDAVNIADYRARLALYRQHKPYIDTGDE